MNIIQWPRCACYLPCNTVTPSLTHTRTIGSAVPSCCANGEWKESHNDGTFAGIVSYECRKNDCIVDINSFSLLLYFLDTAQQERKKRERSEKMKINTARRIVVLAAPLADTRLSVVPAFASFARVHSVQPNKYKHLFYCQHNLEASAYCKWNFSIYFLWLAFEHQ